MAPLLQLTPTQILGTPHSFPPPTPSWCLPASQWSRWAGTPINVGTVHHAHPLPSTDLHTWGTSVRPAHGCARTHTHTRVHTCRSDAFRSSTACTGKLQPLWQGSLPIPVPCHARHLLPVSHRTARTCHTLRAPLHTCLPPASALHCRTYQCNLCFSVTQVFPHIIEVKEKKQCLFCLVASTYG